RQGAQLEIREVLIDSAGFDLDAVMAKKRRRKAGVFN
ncbi:MAG: hypothetical protein JWR40_4851, partial [Massilia sp.]|nr:hypothetical protein [Massilia sp.]